MKSVRMRDARNEGETNERVSVVGQEESVVTERTHGETNLLEVVAEADAERDSARTKLREGRGKDGQVLHHRNLPKQDSVRDRVSSKEGSRQMVGISCFSAVRSENEGVCERNGGLVEGKRASKNGRGNELKPRSFLQALRLAMFAHM